MCYVGTDTIATASTSDCLKIWDIRAPSNEPSKIIKGFVPLLNSSSFCLVPLVSVVATVSYFTAYLRIHINVNTWQQGPAMAAYLSLIYGKHNGLFVSCLVTHPMVSSFSSFCFANNTICVSLTQFGKLCFIHWIQIT